MRSPALGRRRGPSGDGTSRSWEARPWAAKGIRAVVLLGPISVGCAAAIWANRALPASSVVVVAVLRSIGIVVISTAVVWGVDRYARKLLPLAALMQLSLVFPDHAPSRFRSALKSGSSRRLERAVVETRRSGLAKDPGDAARQVVELIGAIGDHDRRTRGHSERVRLYADLVGEELKLTREERQKLQWGALLHDLGKLMVPEEILNKQGRPTEEEWRILQGHPAAGMRLIEPLREFLGEWVHAIGGHHEKWDGSGYPRGLVGHDIPRAAAIVAVADSFEVMTAVRSYKKAMPVTEARAELTRCAGTHFSPEVVRAFLGISLGRIRIVSGPVAALAHLPFVGQITQIPAAAAAAAPGMASAAAMPAAAVMTAAALTIAPTPGHDVVVAADSALPAAAAGASASAESPAANAGATTRSAAPSSGAAGAQPTSTTTPAPSTSTTTVAPAASGNGAPAAAPASPGGSPATTVVPSAPTTAARPTASPTTSPPAPTPTAATPATTAPSAGGGGGGGSSGVQFSLMFATSQSRLPAKPLQGATVSPGADLYVYGSNLFLDRIDYTYPGGSSRAEDAPFDMAGSSNGGWTAKPWKAPTTPGTYTVTAIGRGNSWGSGGGSAPATITVTFTVV